VRTNRLLRAARVHASFLTVTLTNEIATRGHPAPVLLSRRSADEKDAAMASGAPGERSRLRHRFFTRNPAHRGARPRDTSLVEGDAGSTRWRSGTPRRCRQPDAGRVRVLKLAARTDAASTSPRSPRSRRRQPRPGSGGSRFGARAGTPRAFRRLIARGYRGALDRSADDVRGLPRTARGAGCAVFEWEI